MRVFQQLAEARGWTWDQVGDMTLDQIAYECGGVQEDAKLDYLPLLEKIQGADRKFPTKAQKIIR